MGEIREQTERKEGTEEEGESDIEHFRMDIEILLMLIHIIYIKGREGRGETESPAFLFECLFIAEKQMCGDGISEVSNRTGYCFKKCV